MEDHREANEGEDERAERGPEDTAPLPSINEFHVVHEWVGLVSDVVTRSKERPGIATAGCVLAVS